MDMIHTKDRQCKEFTQVNNLDQLDSSSLDIIIAFEDIYFKLRLQLTNNY